MSLPNAYCVKCRTHTETIQKHTVVLQNNSRAMLGVCPVCATENYKILPKKDFTRLKTISGVSHKAYCFKCRDKVMVDYAQAIVFKNGTNALKGCCRECGSDVYKILSVDALKDKIAKAKTKIFDHKSQRLEGSNVATLIPQKLNHKSSVRASGVSYKSMAALVVGVGFLCSAVAWLLLWGF